MPDTLSGLRAAARAATLFPATTLSDAIERLGFVQADPIRAPARAQDLILRHRVAGYRVGDLDRGFARLGLEEDFLYAYGFMPPATRGLLHPRHDPLAEAGVHRPTGLAAEVLAHVRAAGRVHPRDLEAEFGRDRAVNGWGGFSKATTRALESLHRYGLLRVAMRRDGIRVYEAAAPSPAPLAPELRAHRLVMLVVGILAPVSPVGLRGALALMAGRNPGLGLLAPVVAASLRDGMLASAVVDGETYLWPAEMRPSAPRRDVRLLAPFDPIVWDRRRFAHLWGWDYRFEAYVPAGQRRLGYYTLPLLWADEVIGWAAVSQGATGLEVTLGYADKQPTSTEFRRALDAELARFDRFLSRRSRPAVTPPPAS